VRIEERGSEGLEIWCRQRAAKTRAQIPPLARAQIGCRQRALFNISFRFSLLYYTNPGLSVISEGISKPSPSSWLSLSASSPLLLGVFMVSFF